MDFTPQKYSELLQALAGRDVWLRHDVDKDPLASLRIAEIEYQQGCRATYYFRSEPCSFDESVIRGIAQMGHAIGYHYEDLNRCGGDMERAWDEFRQNLDRLRRLAAVDTICMHGCPGSKYDSKDLWKRYDYKSLGIVYEPYLDTDWSQRVYLTDTGRRWDGWRVSRRDKVPGWQEQWADAGYLYHTTDDIIHAAADGSLPKCLLLTTHPQRWLPFGPGWVKELVWQNAKNVVKFFVSNN